MHRNAFVFTGIFVAGCAGAAPTGFSKGDHWSVPLVGALENGHLIVPVSVAGKGPYLFVLDPDSSISAIDQQVVEDAKLRLVNGPSRIDEAGVEQSRGYAELTDLKLGDLTIDHRQVMAVPSDFYNLEGRRINGVIGRDVLADRLVLGLDRDQGLVTLATAQVFTAPAAAIAIKYTSVEIDPITNSAAAPGGASMSPSTSTTSSEDQSRVGVVTRSSGPAPEAGTVVRKVATAQLGGAELKMHLDLGDTVSQLRPELWAKAQLAPAEVKLRLVDEVASVRMVTSAPSADVTLAGAKGHVTLAPYAEKRFGIKKVDGALGLDFFRGYAVYASWATSTLFLRPRGEPAATAPARLGRWGAELPACPHPGCITATLTPTDAGLKLDIARDPQAAKRPLEIYLGVTPAAGKTAASLLVELPANADTVSGGVPRDYEGATLTVLDASPFVRPCAVAGAGCVFDAPKP